MIQNFSNPQTVLFKNGSSKRLQVFIYQGAAMVGDPTAYVMVGNEMVWVIPGQSVSWMEA